MHMQKAEILLLETLMNWVELPRFAPLLPSPTVGTELRAFD